MRVNKPLPQTGKSHLPGSQYCAPGNPGRQQQPDPGGLRSGGPGRGRAAIRLPPDRADPQRRQRADPRRIAVCGRHGPARIALRGLRAGAGCAMSGTAGTRPTPTTSPDTRRWTPHAASISPSATRPGEARASVGQRAQPVRPALFHLGLLPRRRRRGFPAQRVRHAHRSLVAARHGIGRRPERRRQPADIRRRGPPEHPAMPRGLPAGKACRVAGTDGPPPEGGRAGSPG